MLRIIVIVLVLFIAVAGGLAVLLYQNYGWQGLVAFPFIVLGMLWAAKFIIGRLIRKVVMGLFGMKGGALRDAKVEIHSVTPVAPPPQDDTVEAGPGSDSESDAADGAVAVTESPATDDGEPEPPREYFRVELSVTPRQQANQKFTHWEPSEFILASRKIKSLGDLAEDEGDSDHGHVQRVRIWDGTQFGPDESGKYVGPQRLEIIFAVTPGTQRAYLHYYGVPLGEIQFPASIEV